MKPSERMKLQLQRQEPQPAETDERPEESVADRMKRLEREQMEARKRDAALRSGRVIVGEYRRRGRPPRQKRI